MLDGRDSSQSSRRMFLLLTIAEARPGRSIICSTRSRSLATGERQTFPLTVFRDTRSPFCPLYSMSTHICDLEISLPNWTLWAPPFEDPSILVLYCQGTISEVCAHTRSRPVSGSPAVRLSPVAGPWSSRCTKGAAGITLTWCLAQLCGDEGSVLLPIRLRLSVQRGSDQASKRLSIGRRWSSV